MSIRAALELFLEEYPKAKLGQFAADSVADFVRRDLPAVVSEVLGPNPRYVVVGSPGQGVWAQAPWVAIYDRLVTESAQDGYYVVYLAKEDFTGVYLSLNQGVTSAKKQYKGKAKPALRARASDFQVRLGNLVDGLDIGPIDLAATRTTNLSAFYEAGSICSKYYVRNAIPSDDVLAADLRQFIGLYFALVSREDRLFERADAEEDERHLGEEDLRKLREHKRIERNRNLAQRAKRIQGYVCKACGFNFEAKYGALGKQFIEAHHLAPLSELKGQRVTLDPQKDFTVLCSNCHRMIHRTKLVGNIEAFSAQHVKALDKS